MIDYATPKGRIIAAMLRLAGERPWPRVTLADIAEGAAVPLADLTRDFKSKGAILSAFTKAVDEEMLRRAPRRQPGQSARDALFEVIMCRLDVLAPYKTALRSIVASPFPDPEHVRPLLSAQRWMLEGAGISASGASGATRTLGLVPIYASVLRTWLDDDDPGHARTMAALDRRLRRAEQSVTRMDEFCRGVSRFTSAFLPERLRRRSESASGSASDPARPST